MRFLNGRPHPLPTGLVRRAIALIAVFVILLSSMPAVGSNHAADRTSVNYRRLGWGSSALDSAESGNSALGRRLLQASNRDGSTNSLKLRVLHRNSMDSPARMQFSSREEEIESLIAMDELRVKAFSAVSMKLEIRDAQLLPSPAEPPLSDGQSPPSASPSPSPEELEEFQGRVVSGASFAGNLGQYLVEFSIGSPPQPFLFIADTGSDLVWVPCTLCAECRGGLSSSTNGSIFRAMDSSTFSAIACSEQECGLIPPPPFGNSTCSLRDPTSCTYGYSYSDTTQTTGVFAYETITMSSSSGQEVKLKNVAFGCGINNTGPSITGLGGVIGLGQGPISFTTQVGYMYGNRFSYCFTSFFNRKASSALVFGDDTPPLKSAMQYTPFLPNALSETNYYIGVEGVKVAGEWLAVQPELWSIQKSGAGGAVIDSGTTLSFFVQPAYELLVQAVKQAMDYPLAPPTAGLPLCFNVSGVAEPSLPQLAIVFQGHAVFKPPTKNYFLSPTADLRCLGVLSSASLTVFGNLFQQNYYVEYDRLLNRLGFAKARCSLS